MGCGNSREKREPLIIKSKNLFNYENQGVIDEQFKEEYNSYAPYANMPEMTREEVEQYRKMCNEYMGGMSEMEPYKTSLTNVIITSDIVEAMKGNDYSTPINIVKPKNLDANVKSPVIIMSHGGGGFAGNIKINESFSALFADKLNLVVIDVDYRLCPEVGTAEKLVSDVYQVVKFAYENPEKFGIDNTKICIYGMSGGGFATAGVMGMLAKRNESFMVKISILECPVLPSYWFTEDLEKMPVQEKCAKYDSRPLAKMLATNLEKQLAKKDPILFPDIACDNLIKKMPMTIIIEGEFDNYITVSKRFAERLKSHGRCLEFICYPGSHHNYSIQQGKRQDDSIRDKVKIVEEYLNC